MYIQICCSMASVYLITHTHMYLFVCMRDKAKVRDKCVGECVSV